MIGRVGVVHGEDSEGFSVFPVCLISMLLPAFALATVLLAFLLSCFLASCFLAFLLALLHALLPTAGCLADLS